VLFRIALRVISGWILPASFPMTYLIFFRDPGLTNYSPGHVWPDMTNVILSLGDEKRRTSCSSRVTLFRMSAGIARLKQLATHTDFSFPSRRTK
jgi:hypothetical protein